MRGHPGRGAVVGAAAGLLLAVSLIVLPRMVEGDYYEIADPLVFMGLPLLAVSAAVGALIAVLVPRAAVEGAVGDDPGAPRRPSAVGVVILVVTITTAVTGIWLFLWAVGTVDTAPWEIG